MALHNLKIIVYDGGKTRDGIFGSDDSKESGDSKKQEKSLLYKVLNYNSTIKSKMKKATSPTTFFAIQQGISVAVQTGREFINYYVSDKRYRTVKRRQQLPSNYKPQDRKGYRRFEHRTRFANGCGGGFGCRSVGRSYRRGRGRGFVRHKFRL